MIGKVLRYFQLVLFLNLGIVGLSLLRALFVFLGALAGFGGIAKGLACVFGLVNLALWVALVVAVLLAGREMAKRGESWKEVFLTAALTGAINYVISIIGTIITSVLSGAAVPFMGSNPEMIESSGNPLGLLGTSGFMAMLGGTGGSLVGICGIALCLPGVALLYGIGALIGYGLAKVI